MDTPRQSTPPEPFDPSVLRVAGDLRLRGIEPTRTTHVAVRHGVWIEAADWQRLSIDQRYAALVHATVLRCDPEKPPLLSHESAAVLWGLPRIGAWPRRCHVTKVDGVARSTGLIVRHSTPPVAEAQHQGLRLTSVADTVVALAKTGDLGAGLAAADHALRHDMCTREDLANALAALAPGVTGSVQARLVGELADPGSMSAGESLSRAQMFLANLPKPELQVAHEDSAGLIGYVDFDWGGVVGEFDGKLKYKVPEGATPEEAAEILWQEKQREDRLRRRDNRVARWVWADAMRPKSMVTILGEQGIRPRPRSVWFMAS